MSQILLKDMSVAIDGQNIVEQIALSVQPGEFVGLVGPNGSGKSTLLKSLYRVLKPSAGGAWLDGDDIWTITAKQSAQRLAVVGQERMGEFDFTVTELVAMGRTPHKGMFDANSAQDRGIIADCLDQVGMVAKAQRQFMSLSGGEKQRVLVARALAQSTPVLVLDEPTNHLDIRHQIDLLELIRHLRKTTLAALHDLNLAARYCDRIVMLHAGRVVAEGRPHEVLTQERIEAVYEVGALVQLDANNVPSILFSPLRRAASGSDRQAQPATSA